MLDVTLYCMAATHSTRYGVRCTRLAVATRDTMPLCEQHAAMFDEWFGKVGKVWARKRVLGELAPGISLRGIMEGETPQ